MTDLTDRNHAPSAIVRRLDCFRGVAKQIKDGLAGTPFHWNGAEGDDNVMWAEAMGLHLVTATQITKRGYRLKRRGQAVGWRYFAAPIRKSHALYVLECQAVHRMPPSQTSTQEDDHA